MANIALQGVYEQMTRWFQAEGASTRRFEQDFISACNMARGRINRQAALASPIATVTGKEDTINLDDNYLDVWMDAVAVNLMGLAQRPRAGLEQRFIAAERLLDERIDSIRQTILNDRQDSDTDDDTYDNVGLGALG